MKPGRIDRHPYFEKYHINMAFEYYHPTCGWFCDPYELMSRLRYNGIEYRKIPGFDKYYIAWDGTILSLNSSSARILTTQYIRGKTHKNPFPVARLRENTGEYRTRSLYKIVKEVWEDLYDI